MAGRFESALITRIVDTDDFKSAKTNTSDQFFGVECRAAWNYIVRYFTEHGTAPSREVLQAVVPTFEFDPLPDPVAVLSERVNEEFIYNQIALHVQRIGQLAQTNIADAVKMMSDDAVRIRALSAPQGSAGVDIATSVDEEQDAYYRRRDGSGLLGMPWPWPRLNEATLGIRDGQLAVIYARPKQMKTWSLLYTLNNVYETLHKRIVLFTREMSVVELRQRHAALWAKIDYERYMKGKLHTAEEKRWLECLEALREMNPFIIDATIRGSGEEAAEEIAQKCKDYEAELMGIDGMYFYGDRDWEQIGKFTSRVKWHLLNSLGIPCIGTTQGKQSFSMERKGNANADDVGYSDTFAQDADVLIKQARVEEDERIYMSVSAIREGKGARFQIWAKPGGNFTQAYTEDDDEISDGKELDAKSGVGDLSVKGKNAFK